MKIDYSYMEILAKPATTTFDKYSLEQLRDAMDKTSIPTFGWPIAAVIHTKELMPKPIQNGIEARFTDSGHREYWCLKRSGEFYFIGELFENLRKPEYVFIDTRANRITETFLRIGKLFLELDVPRDEKISIIIKHGNIKGKILSVANPARVLLSNRVCNENEVTSEYLIALSDMTEEQKLKDIVHKAVRDLSEMFDMFNPDKVRFTDPIVDAFIKGKIF